MEINPLNTEELLSPPEDLKDSAAGLLGVAAAAKGLSLLKRGAFRSIDTLGLGGNVETTYKSTGKVQQFLDNIEQVSQGKKPKMVKEFVQQLKRKGTPVELKAVDSSLEILEETMSGLKSQGKRIPKAMKEYYLDLKDMKPLRRMASAIKEVASGQEIGFKHGGKFIKNVYPQADPDIKQYLKNKGLNINKPIDVFEISDEKKYISKLRAYVDNDPRVQRIRKALQENRLKDAKRYARTGRIKYGGKEIKGRGKINLKKTPTGYVLKINPMYTLKGGKMKTHKDYVIGGHTQRVHFNKIKGLKGFHRTHTDVIDITTYASAGEKGGGWKNKVRRMLAGKTGQALNITKPVVTKGTYFYRKPGGGRLKGAIDAYKRKRGKNVAASLIKYGGKALKFALTKGRSF
tara:strand:- start:525 stop:1733 length:1209 start_codon:yes stop_codon:yes gene_type:complete